MATQFTETVGVPLIDPVAIEINESIDRLIFLLNQRRAHLLVKLKDKRDEMTANKVARQEMEKQIAETQTFVGYQIKHNLLQSMQMRMEEEMKTKLSQLKLNSESTQELRFLSSIKDLEEGISRMGDIVQLQTLPNIPLIPNYAAFQQPVVAVGVQGSGPGEFKQPQGVTIEPDSGHIYVSDLQNNRIQIFSQTGEHITSFGQNNLGYPVGIVIHQDNIYVTDIANHAILHFKLPGLNMIRKVGKKGSGNKEFDNPKQLAISPDLHVYVADEYNNRVHILTTNLEFKDQIRHKTMTRPVDVKFSSNEMFLLSSVDNPCIHVFTLSGEKIRSLVTRGKGMQIERAFFFCMDGGDNFVISDFLAQNIKVISPEGDLIHTISHHRLKTDIHRSHCINAPYGIAIYNNKIISVSSKGLFCLKIFSD